MKWILGLFLMFSLQVMAENAAVPPLATELTVSAPVTATATVSEAEIPVNLDAAKKTAGPESPLFKIILSMSLVGVLGSAAYFFIKKYMYKGNPKSQANQVKILSQHYIGPKKSLAIIRVAGESILIGVTDHNISLIKELSLLDDEIPETTPKNFQSVFNLSSESESPREQSSSDDEPKDEFSIAGIKDFVSHKLKNMRTLE